MDLFHRGIVLACRRSWRAYRQANFTVTVEGIRVPIVGATGLANLDYQHAQFLAVLKAALTLGLPGHVIDVGANVGRFLLNLLHLDRTVPYIGFEPLLPAAAYVRRLIVDNMLTNHSIVAVALSDCCGMATIRFGSETDVSATLSSDLRPPGMYPYEQRVATSTGDIQLAGLSSIAFLKLDVEGTELFVLRGMASTIDLHRPPMLIEVMPYAYLLDGSYDRSYFGDLAPSEAKRVGEARREHSLAIEAFMRERDYRFYACSPDGRTSPVTTLDRGASRDRETDFLALPSEKAGAFIAQVTSS
jgi:FkbM family methyltransferase